MMRDEWWVLFMLYVGLKKGMKINESNGKKRGEGEF
jgi:hypothetical protein